MIRVLGGPAVLLAVAACGSLPHPFERDGTVPEASALTLPDAPGIVVQPVAGFAPDAGRAVAASMVAALADLDVPAAVGIGNKASFRLSASAAPDRPGRVVWTLARADGSPLGEETEILSAPAQPAPDLAAAARPTAERIALLIGAAAPSTAEVPKRRIAVIVADPAVPEARAALASSLTGALAARGFDPESAPTPGPALRIEGRLTTAPGPTAELTHIKLVWVVTGIDGAEAARLTQENDVPARDLPRGWSAIGPAVAAAIITDLVAVLDRVEPAR